MVVRSLIEANKFVATERDDDGKQRVNFRSDVEDFRHVWRADLHERSDTFLVAV